MLKPNQTILNQTYSSDSSDGEYEPSDGDDSNASSTSNGTSNDDDMKCSKCCTIL